ncbi:MAG: FtsX-like permease family protein [Gemmatimonas sp.]|nr:FtsX-like permease family protein [Gemmatimonas sp.]
MALRPDRDWIRRWNWAGAVSDLRFGVRTLRRNPLYTTGVAGTLALGLAAALITFAVAWRVWLAPMSYPEPERVVRLYELEPLDSTTGSSDVGAQARRQLLSAPVLKGFREHSWRTIEAVSAVLTGLPGEWARDGDTQDISRAAVSPEFFGILGIVPTLGRLPADLEAEAEVLLTERFWRTDLGADPDVVGSEMILGDQALRVVGVVRLPSGYPGPSDDVVTIIKWDGDEPRILRFIETIARVRPGYSPLEARAEVNAFVAALGEIHPEHRGWGMDAVGLADDLMRPFRGVLALLLAAGATFLLLAGVNVLGLVAARRVEGRQDRSIRLALGASEGRLLRGSLGEGLVLALVGSITGVVVASWLIGPLRALVPQNVPRLADVAITPPLVLGWLSVGVALGLIIGVSGYLVSRGAKPSVGRAPVWRAVGVGGRRALVVGQIALTTLLTAGAAAILHNASRLRAIDLGFEAEGLSMARTALPGARYSSPELRWNAWRAILDGLHARGIPAAVAENTPMYNSPMSGDNVPPFPIRADAASEEIFYQYHPVSADYFSVMGIDVLAGRAFGPVDYGSSADVVIVSEEFVGRYFPPGTPVERVLGRVIGPVPAAGGAPAPTIVGVVASSRHQGPDAPVMPDLYVPLSRWFAGAGTLLVKGEPDQVAEVVATVVAQVDPDLSWTPLVPYTSHLEEWFAPLRLQIIMIGVLGSLGLGLAALGLYSVMAYQVSARRQELGIRKAVGATEGKLMRGVLASGVTMAAVGALIGLGTWYRLLPFSRELVDGIDSAGYLVPLSVALIVGGSCVLATFLPAIRAARVDPVVTLKGD